jgi:selenocysteine-specific elongation factor
VIVTLAGHVDHGKTSLVERLTGTNTDRLGEERRRGLTIDLGFAYLRRGDAAIGFVDVPGHHRFIHNMVAGIAARQHALLVIAADDGPMPQSREHLQILRLLGLSGGIVALTKCDRVEPARLAAARAEIGQLVAGSFLEDAPVVATSAVSGAGIDELAGLLTERAGRPAAGEVTPRPFRLAVDRAFSLRGSGLVVTGTVHSGSVARDDEVYLFPSGTRARVRELRVQDHPADRAGPGDRTALNLAGLNATPERGDWVCAQPDPGHTSLVVDLEVLADFPRPVRHWAPVHVYHATSHATARLALLDGSRAAPGESVRAELILDRPLLAKRGDRLILRDQALERTLGGGAVIDNRGLPGRRRAPRRLAAIDAAAAPDPGAALDALLALGPVDPASFQRLWDLDDGGLEELLGHRDARLRQGQLVSDRTWQTWADALAAETEQRHAADPALAGLRENEFAAAVPAAFRGRLLAELVAAGRIEERTGRFRPVRHRAALDPAERDLLERLQPHLDQPQPPSLGDLGKLIRMPLPQLQRGVKPLAGKGELVLIGDKRVFLPGYVAELADVARRLSAAGAFTARDFRDAAGIGRNVAIDVLEFFDDRRFTRRQGDTRIVVGDAP